MLLGDTTHLLATRYTSNHGSLLLLYLSTDLMQLSDEAFKSVPPSIRSKVKLPDLNRNCRSTSAKTTGECDVYHSTFKYNWPYKITHHFAILHKPLSVYATLMFTQRRGFSFMPKQINPKLNHSCIVMVEIA